MKLALRFFAAVHIVIATLFAAGSLGLVAVAACVGWNAFAGGPTPQAGQDVIEALGLLAAGVVALQIAQTVVEEEVVRGAQVSAPTRVRRFLSRFFVVVVVALAVEGLVATFRAVHEDMRSLLYSGGLLAATAALLAGWGVFIRLNRAAEELEPEAMERAKREDEKVEEIKDAPAQQDSAAEA